ncbi:lens fiber membrane intrinsic protein-like isoform X2 [Hyperolius riggenbachi]
MLCGNVVGITCASLTFIMLLTGILSDYWLVNFGKDLFHQGIWQQCTKNLCHRLTGIAFLDATRGLLICSTAFLLFGILFSCLTFLSYHVGKVTASLAAAAVETLSAVFLIIGMAVYTGNTSDRVLNNSYNYQWSFFLCWASALTSILAVISHILAHTVSPIPGYESV